MTQEELREREIERLEEIAKWADEVSEKLGAKLQRKFNYNRFEYSRNPDRAMFFKEMAAEAAYQLGLLGYAPKGEIEKRVRDAYRDIGENLCVLAGNLMLEDKEAGRKLAEQLQPIFEYCQKNAGILPLKSGGKEGEDEH